MSRALRSQVNALMRWQGQSSGAQAFGLDNRRNQRLDVIDDS
jgi:hypothetical protein